MKWLLAFTPAVMAGVIPGGNTDLGVTPPAGQVNHTLLL